MKLTKLTLGFATLALGIMSAASSYKLTLTDPAWVGDTQLKPGEYKVEMQGDMAVFKGEKQTVQAAAVEEKGEKKFPYTSFESMDSKIQEIHVGGTNLTIKLKDAPAATKAAGSGL
ncbi:MAG TPA: hypothetical protein VKV74_12310 [Bryobacteraceae bacterium]|nr:hypothetical protein [Bryobacteraceae bacterium]